MMIALLLAALPVIFWNQGPETAVALKQNGIEQVLVPAERLQAWKTTGLVCSRDHYRRVECLGRSVSAWC